MNSILEFAVLALVSRFRMKSDTEKLSSFGNSKIDNESVILE